MATRKWVDLSRQGVYFGDLPWSGGKAVWVLVDTLGKGDPLALREMGFYGLKTHFYHEEGIYFFDQKNNPSFPIQQLSAHYGEEEPPIIEIDDTDLQAYYREFISIFTKKTQVNLQRFLDRSKFLGVNSNATEVYEQNAPDRNRFIKLDKDGKNFIEPENKGRAKEFLRAYTQDDLATCADAYVGNANLITNENKNGWKHLDNFAKVIFSKDQIDDEDRRKTQEAIEAAALRLFTHYAKNPGKEAYEYAIEINEKLPVAKIRTAASIHLQQYSTPLPISTVAQRLLAGEAKGAKTKTILEPSAGNGGLCNLISHWHQVYALEIDETRFQEIKRLSPAIVAKLGDTLTENYTKSFNLEDGFDLVITNPPFGQLDRPRQFDKIPSIYRTDHYLSLKALSARKDKGRAVIIVGGDGPRSDGTIQGGGRIFTNYLYDHYHVDACAEIDGKLYAKSGSAYNIRIFVIGDKRNEPITADIPEKLAVIDNYQTLWEWSETVYQSIHQNTVLTAGDSQPKQFIQKAPVVQPAKVDSKEIDTQALSQIHYGKTTNDTPPDQVANDYQAPYLPSSQIGQPSSMIPINMAAATYEALERLNKKHGDIDEYVSHKLQYEPSELTEFFSPEQVDAIGLAIKALDEGRGIINADQTGMGKGRFLAAMMRYAKLNDRVPIFLTIKPELFTDIFRDISDIGSDHLFKKLFIFNDGETVKKYGTENQVLFRATTTLERTRAMSSQSLEDDVDMVLATYSQFMRAFNKNTKANLLVEISCNNGFLILDEAHVASGSSNISDTLGQAVEKSQNVIYASATPLKGVTNFAIYNKVFPESVDISSLPETLASGGEALQEAISTNMARDGVLIRREHDFSNLTFSTYYPSDERNARNREYANMLANILSGMCYLSGDVQRTVNDINKQAKKEWEAVTDKERYGKRMQASSMNFGSRLYNINRQFLMSLKIDDAIECALDCLANGQKPVIAVENTGESLLKQVIIRYGGVEDMVQELEDLKGMDELDDEKRSRISWLDNHISSRLNNIVLEEPPQFRDLLSIMLDRIRMIKVQGRYGDVNYETPRSEEYYENEAEIKKLIEDFPDLPLSPIDIIKNELRKNGYEVAEVSGRTISLTPSDVHPGRWNQANHPKADAVSNVAGFQNGKYDAIIITRSGSTGISLHATDRFEDSDSRQRNFIVLQKAANIAEFLQWMGRVNRKDQVVPPFITNLESGLPAELRLSMMHNSKLRNLSANTTSNRSNANVSEEAYDLLNDVGDSVALEWLFENSDIANHLDITLPTDEDQLFNSRNHQNSPYINKLMGRLMMVEVGSQEKILDQLSDRYAEKIEELNQKGENPFKIDIFDWKAKTIGEEVLTTGISSSSNSAFDEPVKIANVSYEKEVVPIDFGRLKTMAAKGSEIYDQKYSALEIRSKAEDGLTAYIRSKLPEKYINDEASLGAILENNDVVGAKMARDKGNWLIKNIMAFRPGVALKYDHKFKGEITGIITSVEYPSKRDDVYLLSKYLAKVVFPGEDRPTDITLAAIRTQDKPIALMEWVNIESKHVSPGLADIQASFDNAPKGKLTRTHWVLQGNVFRACEMATSQKIGSPILYTDDKGNRQRAVLIKDRISPDMVKTLPIGMNGGDLYLYVMNWMTREIEGTKERFLRIFNKNVKEMEYDEGISLLLDHYDRGIRLYVPGSKNRAGYLLTDGYIFDIGANTPSDSLRLNLTGTRKYMSAKINFEELEPLLLRLQEKKHVAQYYIPYPNHEIIEQLNNDQTLRKPARNKGRPDQNTYCAGLF